MTALTDFSGLPGSRIGLLVIPSREALITVTILQHDARHFQGGTLLSLPPRHPADRRHASCSVATSAASLRMQDVFIDLFTPIRLLDLSGRTNSRPKNTDLSQEDETLLRLSAIIQHRFFFFNFSQ